MRTPPQDFDQLDELPTRRAGGYIIGVKPARGRMQDGERTANEFRSREQMFPRLARRQNYLAILTQMLEKERTDQ